MLINKLNDQGISVWFRKQGFTNLNILNMNLSDRKLKKISKYIYTYVRLRQLELSKNSLNSLPSTIQKCKTLENIAIRYNKFQSFPSVLFKIKNLQVIRLNYNSIEKLNKSDTDLLSYSNDLHTLDLSNNKLKKFVISGDRNLKLNNIHCENNPKLRYFEHTSSNNLVFLDVGKGVRELTLDNIKLGPIGSLETIHIPLKNHGLNNITNERSARLTISEFVARNPTIRGGCQINVWNDDRRVLTLTAREVGNRRANEEAARARNAEQARRRERNEAARRQRERNEEARRQRARSAEEAARRAQEAFREQERRRRDPNRVRRQQQTNNASRQARENNNAHRRDAGERRQQRNQRRRTAQNEANNAAIRAQERRSARQAQANQRRRARQAERNRREQRGRNTYMLKSGENGTTIWYSYFTPQNGNLNFNDENVNKNDLFFIDSDVTRNKVIRHLFHKETVTNGLYPTVLGYPATYEHPITKARFSRSNMKMLKNYRYFVDRPIPSNTSNSNSSSTNNNNNSNSNRNKSLNDMARSRNTNLSKIVLRISQLNNVALTNVTKNHILQKFYRRMDLLRGERRDAFYKLFKDVVFRYLRPQDKRNAYNYYRQANLNSSNSNSNYR